MKPWKDRYRLDPVPLGSGGYAQVYGATHKSTGEHVALKKVLDTDPDKAARLRREVEYLTKVPHPNIMPILDSAPDGEWYAMPVATRSLYDLHADRPLDDSTLMGIVRQIAAGLRAAHELALVHRDVSPTNILLLEDSEPRWVVADWGMVRRPPGETTAPRTFDGRRYGTHGFAAPEMYVSAHDADSRADIYSLGRIIEWAKLGDTFNPAVLQLPTGPWREIVRRATATSVGERPQSIADLQELVDRISTEGEQTPLEKAEGLLSNLQAGDYNAVRTVVDLARSNPEDTDMYLSVVSKMSSAVLSQLVQDNHTALAELVGNIRRQLTNEYYWNRNGRRLTSTLLDFVQLVAGVAKRAGNQALLQDCAATIFAGDEKWEQFDRARKARGWLQSHVGSAARTVADALRFHPGAARWYQIDGWRPSSVSSPLREVLEEAKAQEQ